MLWLFEAAAKHICPVTYPAVSRSLLGGVVCGCVFFCSLGCVLPVPLGVGARWTFAHHTDPQGLSGRDNAEGKPGH